jgi:hypothetical protein
MRVCGTSSDPRGGEVSQSSKTATLCREFACFIFLLSIITHTRFNFFYFFCNNLVTHKHPLQTILRTIYATSLFFNVKLHLYSYAFYIPTIRFLYATASYTTFILYFTRIKKNIE